MIELEYYRDYEGPELTLAQIWKHESKKKTLRNSFVDFMEKE